jgi:hypothetical protein
LKKKLTGISYYKINNKEMYVTCNKLCQKILNITKTPSTPVTPPAPTADKPPGPTAEEPVASYGESPVFS